MKVTNCDTKRWVLPTDARQTENHGEHREEYGVIITYIDFLCVLGG
jgi:hypothetical protein